MLTYRGHELRTKRFQEDFQAIIVPHECQTKIMGRVPDFQVGLSRIVPGRDCLYQFSASGCVTVTTPGTETDMRKSDSKNCDQNIAMMPHTSPQKNAHIHLVGT